MEIIEYKYREVDNNDVIAAIEKKAKDISVETNFNQSCGQLYCEIDSKAIKKFCDLLNKDADLSFEYLKCLTAVDYMEYLEMVYCLYSFKNNWSVNIKVRLDASNPSVESVTPVYSGADWHERETAEMFGIDIKGHPDMKTLLLAGDEEVPPLRKSYELEWKEKEYIPPEKFE